MDVFQITVRMKTIPYRKVTKGSLFTMSGKENGAVFRKKAKPEDSSEPDRIWMSVKEMGDLLGIRKTDQIGRAHV